MASTLKVDTITTPDGTGNITFSRPIVGNLTAQKNLIINGDFDIWQRGTSFAAAANATFTADRWKYIKTGTMVHTISRSTDVPTVAESGHLSNYSLLADCTTVDSSADATDRCGMRYNMEGYDFKQVAQQELTISFWHKHTKTGEYSVGVKNSGADRSYVGSYTQTATDTWEKATVTVTASPSAGTWDYTNGVGAYIQFSMIVGANYAGVDGTWESANDDATSGQVNACDNAANNFMLSQVQLEAGSVATDFEIRNHTTELAMCKRYYREEAIGDIAAVNTTTADGMIHHDGMRVAPSVTAQAAITIADAGAAFTQSSASVATATVTTADYTKVRIANFTSLVADDPFTWHDSDETRKIQLSAEL